ncbi:MAG: oxygenase MpaB family protein, partial [Jatrophihabitans sp.]
YREFPSWRGGHGFVPFCPLPSCLPAPQATLALLVSRFVAPLRPLARWSATLLLDVELLQALRLPVPPRPARRLARLALRARAVAIRLGPPRPAGRPYRFRARSYPDGDYRLAELGPVPR